MQTSLERRLDRLESAEAIRQLAAQYGVALDVPDLDTLVSLYVTDATVVMAEPSGPLVKRTGREALKEWFASTPTFGRPRSHFVGNHVISFTDDDSACGIVYCQASAQGETVGDWTTVLLKYEDQYTRRDGRWYFLSRYAEGWYSTAFRPLPHLDLLGDLRRAFPRR